MDFHGHSVQVSTLVNLIPVLATVVTTILSIILARANLRYAHAADRTVELAHEQFEREWAPELHIRLERAGATDAKIIVTNLAKTSVLLQIIQFRNIAGPLPLEKQQLNDPLIGGTAWTSHLGERILNLTGKEFAGPIAASVSFYAAGRLFRTDWFRFKVEVRGGRFEKIEPVTLPARRVRVLEPHRVRRFRKPLVTDVAQELVGATKRQE